MSAGRSCLGVLVVDDEPLMVAAITAILEDWAGAGGLELFTAASAAEARAVLARQDGTIGLVISDLLMPGGNGSELLREVRERWPDTVTMIVSGASDLTEMREVSTAGVFAHLVKPFEPATLLAEAGKAVEVARLRRENRRHEQRLRGELVWAGELQHALLRPDLPPDPRFALSIEYRPLPEFQCGGDFYDVAAIGDDRRRLLIGDVGGHGIRAALVAAFMKALVAAVPAASPSPPGLLLDTLNRRLCHALKDAPGLFVTFFATEVDLVSRTLACAGAGHPPLYVLRGNEAIALASEGPGLGFDPRARFPERRVHLAPGDVLVGYTDGVREIFPGDPAEAERAFSRMLLASRDDASLAAAVMSRALAAGGRTGFADDATVVTATIA